MTNRSQAVEFTLNGALVQVVDDGSSLLDVLRGQLDVRSAKDGCSPQGQCGCCTVMIDNQPRVSCVTPARRVAGREVITMEGLDEADRWAEAFTATGASQCGFCTPGIIMRLVGVAQRKGALDESTVRDSLKAHLCRCTGWQTIVEAAVDMPVALSDRDLDAASTRAGLEGNCSQRVGPEVALGAGGFADDTAPPGALVAVRGPDGEWVVGETLTDARASARKVQGRRTTQDLGPPLSLPEGEFDLVLQTSWVDPAYLETDASWCEPGGEPSSPLANGGAFGAKLNSEVAGVARHLADQHGRPVRVLFSREDTTRLGPKRPPIAAGVRRDGTGVIKVASTPGVAAAIASVAPQLDVIEVDLPGPSTSVDVRGAGWVEAAVLLHAAAGRPVVAPNGAGATASFDGSTLSVTVKCGKPLDEVALRSYCIGAAHMAYSWVTSESLTVDESGEVLDLTVRSFGVARAVDTPHIDVAIQSSTDEPVNGSDAVFAAVAAEVWRYLGHPPSWPAAL